jgi:hypothetical protein
MYDLLLHLYRVVFGTLMFAFATRESLHLAEAAWCSFRSAHGEHKFFIKRALRLALVLGLCTGPIGHYGFELNSLWSHT